MNSNKEISEIEKKLEDTVTEGNSEFGLKLKRSYKTLFFLMSALWLVEQLFKSFSVAAWFISGVTYVESIVIAVGMVIWFGNDRKKTA